MTPTEAALVEQWNALSARHARVNAALERELQRRHQLSVTEFEVLQRLAGHAGAGCRLQELVDDVHMSQSALSRLVSRLEAEGLVCRNACTEDRRGIYAALSPLGTERLAAAVPTQRAVLAEHLG